jgi:hypothetical protein
MSSVLDLLNSQLGPQGIEAISRQLGIDPQTAQQAIAGAVPILTGAMAQNAASPQGAASLHNALQQHDGSILDRAMDYIGGGDTSGGASILGHILGSRQQNAATGLGRATGLDAGTAGRLLMMLAPLVLGALGRVRRQQAGNQMGDPGDLADVVRSQHEQARNAAPPGILGALTGMLDANHDGSIVDDVTRLGGGVLGGLFGGKR